MALTWSALATPPPNGVNSLIYAGGLWVGVGDGIYTSPDGEVWTSRTNPIGGTLTKVFYLALGHFPAYPGDEEFPEEDPPTPEVPGTLYFVACGPAGIITSTNGTTWTAGEFQEDGSPITSPPIVDVYAHHGGFFSGSTFYAARGGAVANGDVVYYILSDAGTPWSGTSGFSFPSRALICAANDGNLTTGESVVAFLDPVAAGDLRLSLGYVDSGSTLTDYEVDHGDGGSDMGYGASKFVLPDGSGVAYRVGATWSNVDFSSPVGSIAAAARLVGDVWVVTFGQSSGPGSGASTVSMSSDDLISWSEDTMPVSAAWCPAASDGTTVISLSRSGGDGAKATIGEAPPAPSGPFWTQFVNTDEIE